MQEKKIAKANIILHVYRVRHVVLLLTEAEWEDILATIPLSCEIKKMLLLFSVIYSASTFLNQKFIITYSHSVRKAH